MGDDGIAYLAVALIRSKFCKVKTLWLVGCDIGPEGCKALALILYYTKTLKTLNISLNKIAEKGAIMIR